MSSSLQTPWSAIDSSPRAPFKARVARAIVRPAVDRLDVQVGFPSGDRWGSGGPEAPRMRVTRPDAFFSRLGADVKVGFGEAYMAGDWAAAPGTDLAELLTPFAERLSSIVPKPLQRFRRFVDERLPEQEENSIEGSKANIERHYDLSNELFARFLDPTMSYSAALFADPEESLEVAQYRKIDAALDLAQVGPGTRLLEIGTGWGALALRAAQRGAAVTTITISREQAALARERFRHAGAEVDLQVIDYRDVSGTFDAIVSIEMIEAVGTEYWPTYFGALDRLLAPGGHVVLQAITMDHHRHLATRNSYGWIQKYIFPGGMIPSLKAIEQVVAEHTSLTVTSTRAFAADYALTLRRWRETFLANWESIQAEDPAFDESFRRMWEFYLAYCEAGFASGYLNVEHLHLTRR